MSLGEHLGLKEVLALVEVEGVDEDCIEVLSGRDLAERVYTVCVESPCKMYPFSSKCMLKSRSFYVID